MYYEHCIKWKMFNKGNTKKCKEWKVYIYDLTDAVQRKELIDKGFKFKR